MSTFSNAAFLGVDLGWYGKPSGLASIAFDREGLSLRNVTSMEDTDDILRWIKSEGGGGSAVVAVDAPLVICNRTGIRDAERELNREFRRFHAACHAANLGRPFAKKVLSFSRRLETLGFGHGAEITARQQGRFQIEVHPHAAMVNLFDLALIVKYKRGRRAERAKELRRLRRLMLSRLPLLDPALSLQLHPVPNAGNLKPVEDQIDAVLCAYIAAHWWLWAGQKSHVRASQLPSPPVCIGATIGAVRIRNLHVPMFWLRGLPCAVGARDGFFPQVTSSAPSCFSHFFQ